MNQRATKLPQGHKASIESATARPQALPVAPAEIPAALKERPQWVAWRYERPNNKWTKVPINPHTGGKADATNPATWGPFETALARYQDPTALLDGIGYVFAAADEFAGIDLDDCRDPTTGTVAAWAQADLNALDSYTEVSPSGTGVKVFVRGKLPPGGRKRKPYEMYDERRFFAVTGWPLDGCPPRSSTARRHSRTCTSASSGTTRRKTRRRRRQLPTRFTPLAS
jgi:primase-polymerase (primpol)-like protein